MKVLCVLLAIAASMAAQEPAAPGLRGTVTDPSGAAVPGAIVQLRGPGGEKRTRTDPAGSYVFPSLPPGKYELRVSARGFAVADRRDLRVDRAATYDVRLAIQSETQTVDVAAQTAGSVSTEPANNGGAMVLGEPQLAALSDDPDELAQQLQALAGPAPGPGGGQIYIDGFLGGNLPPKSAIREIRINANPYSPEYDRPGFARIEIFTKPGSDTFHGEALAQYNNRELNSRNPLLAQSTRPPYQVQLYRLSVGGPIRKQRASFTFDAERRQIDESVLVLAAVPGGNINEGVSTPTTRTAITPRLDWTLSPRNTLVARYQDVRFRLDNQGVGGFSLPSRAYDQVQTENTGQVTETAMLGPRAIHETRFQFQHSNVRNSGNDTLPGIDVIGAFYGGGATIGNSITNTNSWELTDITSYIKGTHTLKWGGRVRQSRLTDTSYNNFAGTYTFYSLADYLQGRPAQFSLNTGTPTTLVNQTDAGLFANDDWRVRANLTVSFGVRYEAQTNLRDRSDWAPRIGVAWAITPKTVLRAGFGAFYDRVPDSVTLNARRYNGATQQSYLILNPPFYPAVPALARQPQELQPVSAAIVAPRLYQASAGIERQFGRSARLTATWINGRGVHLMDARNINAPIGGLYPYGDAAIRLLTESAGFSRLNQVVVSPNVNYKGLVLFGYYSLSFGRDNTSCSPAGYSAAACAPADPYDLRAEWGPSLYGDVRQRLAAATAIPLPGGLRAMPILIATSGQPYNIVTGLDPSSTGFPAQRPALLAGLAGPACQGSGLVYAASYGCFNLFPAKGAATIARNFGRGPATASLGLRLSKTWSFGAGGESGMRDSGSGGGHGPGGSGPPHGMFEAASGRKYNLTVSATSMNVLNRANLAAPNGDLSSPYFGQSLGLADLMGHMSGNGTYNRRIDLQVRFTF